MLINTSERTLDINEEMCACFTGWQKVFDRVNWTRLIQIPKGIGIDGRKRRLISRLCIYRSVKIRLEQGDTRGTRQERLGFVSVLILLISAGDTLISANTLFPAEKLMCSSELASQRTLETRHWQQASQGIFETRHWQRKRKSASSRRQAPDKQSRCESVVGCWWEKWDNYRAAKRGRHAARCVSNDSLM
jgi:hypothetical protein